MDREINRLFVFWLRHPWPMFWGIFAGFVLINLLLNYRPPLGYFIAFLLLLGMSFVLGLRASWKNSPIKAVVILVLWGIVPFMNHAGVGMRTIPAMLSWILAPIVLAAFTEYVVRRIEQNTGRDDSL